MLKPNNWFLDPHSCPGFKKNELIAHKKHGSLIHHTEYLHIQIPSRYALVNISRLLEDALERSGVHDGTCFVSTMHITAGVYVNDAESGLLHDISKWIEKLAPYGENYEHHQTGEDNGDAHLKSYLTNHFLIAPITNGHFDFGTWQQVFYAEFDGHRTKRLIVKFMGLANESGK